MKKTAFAPLIPILFALLLAACGGKVKGDKPVITVTIEPLRHFTEAIAGDRYTVNVMVPKGGSPETYEPTPRQMAEVAASALYIKVGDMGFERTWVKRIQDDMPHLIILDSSAGIARERSINGVPDPHTWMSVANAWAIANNICDQLQKIAPNHAAEYEHNLQQFRLELQQLDDDIRAALAKSGAKAFAIYHPALTYFARDYGLTQIPIEEEGHEPTARTMADVVGMAKEKQVKTLFVQAGYDNRQTEAVAHELGVESTPVTPLAYDWEAAMRDIAAKLK